MCVEVHVYVYMCFRGTYIYTRVRVRAHVRVRARVRVRVCGRLHAQPSVCMHALLAHKCVRMYLYLSLQAEADDLDDDGFTFLWVPWLACMVVEQR